MSRLITSHPARLLRQQHPLPPTLIPLQRLNLSNVHSDGMQFGGPPNTAQEKPYSTDAEKPRDTTSPPSSGASGSSPQETSSAQSKGPGKDNVNASTTESARGSATEPVEDVKGEEAAQGGRDAADEGPAGASKIAGRK